MSQQVRGIVLPPFCVVLLCSVVCSIAEPVGAAELAGSIEHTVPKIPGATLLPANASNGSGFGAATSTSVEQSPLLKGGVKDDAALQSSLKLIRSAPLTRNTAKPMAGRIDGVSVGTGVRDFTGAAPRSAIDRPEVSSSSPGTSGVIPPISTYTFTPRIITTPATNVITPVSSIRGVTTWVAGQEPPQVVSCGTGVSVKPGYEYTVLKTEFSSECCGALAWRQGGSSSGFRPVGNALAPSSPKGVVVWAPGHEVSISASGNGVSCAPGYEVTVSVPGGFKETLGGHWTAPSSPVALRADELPINKIQVEPLSATPYLLPSIRATAIDGKLSWNDWYNRVAKAIYGRWENAEVCAGIAKVRITVKADRQLAGQVIDFVPVQVGDRNVSAETIFREAALHSVNLVNTFEIPPFPVRSISNVVSFDVELRRVVDGPVGVSVASVESNTTSADEAPED